jgi:hypothetical protein
MRGRFQIVKQVHDAHSADTMYVDLARSADSADLDWERIEALKQPTLEQTDSQTSLIKPIFSEKGK